MARMETEGVRFDLPAASRVMKFDQQDKNSPDYHPLHAEMKAVDLIAELPGLDLYVEIKDFLNRETGMPTTPNLEHLLESLKYKFRDTFLFRYGQGKGEKHILILYVCLIENLDTNLLMQLQKRLRKCIPVGIINGWMREILHEVVVVDKDGWNRNLYSFGTVS